MSIYPPSRYVTIALLSLALVYISNLPCLADEASQAFLVVPPGGTLELAAPEAGVRYEAALDGGLLQPVSEVTAPAAGRHWLTVVSRDQAGNLSEPRFLLLWVDGEAPRLNFEVTPRPVEDTIQRRWVPPRAQATVTAEDAPAGVSEVVMQIDREGTREVASGPAQAQALLPLDGSFEIKIWAVDTVGNRTDEATVSLLVDAEPPRGDIQLQGDAWIETEVEGVRTLVTPPSAQLQARVSDPETGLDRWIPRINGEEVSLDVWRRQDWPAGRYRAEVSALDRVGNQADLEPLDFIVDAEGPTVDWTVTSTGVERDGAWVYRPPVTVELTSSDAIAGVAELDWTGEQIVSAEPRGLDGGKVVVDGTSLSLRAVDRVGNATQVEATWTVDRDAPRFVLRAPDGSQVPAGETLQLREGESVHVQAVDDGAGIETQEVAVDGIHWTVAPRDVRFPGAGRNRLVARAVDRLGHRSEATWEIRVRQSPREPSPGEPPAGEQP